MRALLFLSLLLGAIMLIPSGAHVLEMPHKFAMDHSAYLTAQQMYAGWALFGLPIIVKLPLDATLCIVMWQTRRPIALGALSSAIFIGSGLIVFFLYVQPANLASANWTMHPPNWVETRNHWEYGHLAIAGFTFLAFVGLLQGTTKAI